MSYIESKPKARPPSLVDFGLSVRRTLDIRTLGSRFSGRRGLIRGSALREILRRDRRNEGRRLQGCGGGPLAELVKQLHQSLRSNG